MGDERERVVIDNETGEAFVQTAIDVTPKKGKKPARNDGFFQVWGPELLKVDLGNAALRVLMALASRMDPKTGEVEVHLDALNSELGYAHTNKLSKHIGELVAAGVARRRPGRRVALDPNIVWRGSAGDRTVVRWRWHGETREANT